MEQEVLSGLMEIQRCQKHVITPNYKSSSGEAFVSCSEREKKKAFRIEKIDGGLILLMQI